MSNIRIATFPSADSISLTKVGDFYLNRQLVIQELDEIEITEILDNIYGFLQTSVKELAVYEFNPSNNSTEGRIYYADDDFFEYYCGWSVVEDDTVVLDAYMVNSGSRSGCIFSQYEITDQFGFEAAKRALIKDLNESMEILEDAFYG